MMKKTFITLLALAGVAMGETTQYDLLAGNDNWTFSNSTSINNGVLSNSQHWGRSYAVYTLGAPITLNSNTSLELSYTMTFMTASDVAGTVSLHSSSDVLAFGALTYNGSSNDAPFCIGYSTAAAAISADAITFNQGYGHILNSNSYFETDKTVGIIETSGEDNNPIQVTKIHNIKETISWNDVEQKFVATIYIDGTEAGTQTLGDSYVLNKISVATEGDFYKNSQPKFSNMTLTVNNIPEPATATLSLLAFAGLAARRRRK